MSSVYWWKNNLAERFWLEATDRQDIGADLRAPEFDDGGRPNWRYTLFKESNSGDIVFHYDKNPTVSGVVGFSTVAGSWKPEPITWVARGTYSRAKQSQPLQRPGFVIPLTNFCRFPEVLSLDRIRKQARAMKVLIGELGKKHKSLPLYFPFELSDKRPSRLLQGYAFKLPSAFLSLFPELSSIELADIKSGKRNPSWSRDELILALDLYMKNPASPPSKNSREVEETSELLILLSKKLGMGYSGSYRNRNGVYMKMMNFRRFDPAFVSSGKVGLKSGNKKEATVWHDFAHDRERLSAVALAIRKAIRMTSNEEMDDIEEEDVSEAEEGRLLTRLHRVRERSRKLVDRRKSLALARYGYLKCEGCGFNYEERYGERGKGFIEAHHTTPIHTLGEDNKTKLEDLALVCANCHRILHAKRPWLSMDELRKLLRKHQEPAPHTDRSQKE